MDTELATQSTFLICYKGKWHFLLLMNAHHDWHQPAEYGPFLVHPRSLAQPLKIGGWKTLLSYCGPVTFWG